MTDDGMRRTVLSDDGPYRLRALDDGGAARRQRSRLGVVMAGQVEGDDPISRRDKGFDENRHVRPAPAPTVYQVHERTRAPRLPGDAVAVDALTYPGFRMLAELQDLDLQPVPALDEGPDLDALERLCARRRIRAIHAMPTLHNPLGWVMSPAHWPR